MTVPSFRSALPALLVILVMVAGCLATLPLATWFWWAGPPLEIYYSDAYFSSTTARRNPAATIKVEWLHKTAPGRADQLAKEQDVVADSPGNQRDIRIPMHLSSAARSAGWSELIQGPRVAVKAGELEQFLRVEYYGGQTFWRLFERPILCVLGFVFAVLGVREWFTGRSRRVRAERLAMCSQSPWDYRADWQPDWLGLRWFMRPRGR